uniref:Kinetochore associated 1 n=1 Tax=Serinus canaria TaxID=9135 RepID=A0A8C9N345_SERCA
MWNEIELLLNEDTGRLPVGLGQECGTALYQVDTLLQITSSEKVSVNPQLHACSSRDGSIVVVDRSVSLLDSTGLSLLMHIQFDTIVDVVGMCQDKQFLVVGERSGSLHLIHIPSKQTLLTKVQSMVEADVSMVKYLLSNPIFLCLSSQGKGDCVLSKWEVDPTNALVSAQSFTSADFLFNCRIMWDIYSLTLIWDWPLTHIEEFLLTTESDSSQVTWQGLANVKLIVMTMPDDKQMRSLMVFALPTMQQLYSLEVSPVSSLVQSGICTDTIYFLEGIHEKPSEDPVSIVVMRSLTEALPENRLSRLLHKHKFTEAENFAIQFGLDVELVYKVKANTILEKLASASLGSYGQEALLDLGNEAKENLQKIQDSQFVVNYCLNAPWPLYETTREMLNYAKVRVRASFVLRAQARLTTFCEAFGLEKFSGIAWTEFLNNEDVFKIIVFQLDEGNLGCAQYLWLRHQADFESSFDEKMLKDLLNAIHFTAPLKELCAWLKNFVIPFSRRVVPDGQKILAKWLEQAARNLELTDKANWPENGLQVAEIFFTSKNQGELGVTAFGKWTPLRCGDYEEIQRLKKLVNDLQELRNLYRKYNCRLAFCDFEKENAATIVFRMLDKILAPELVPSILEKFIKPYLSEHKLQKDELLLQYVKDLLERCRTGSISVFETAWEAKAVAVIGCISDTDVSMFHQRHQPAVVTLGLCFPPQPFGDTQLTFAHRTRAFRCLLYLADTNTVESLFKKPIEKVKYFLKCCIYLAEFEILNIPYTYESFHKSPKEGMIKGLWKNHSHEPRAVRLVTELSLEYQVYDPQLWNGLLQKLLGFNMVRKFLRLKLCSKGRKSFSRAWCSVVIFTPPFSLSLSASCPPSPRQLQECRECFVLLCPVLADLDIVGIAKQYTQLDLPAFALGCLLVIPHSEKREKQIQVNQKFCVLSLQGRCPQKETVLQQLDEHMDTGELVAFASQISSLVLDSIINEKLYEQFWKTKYYPLLKQHLINTHRIKELVDYFAKNNCLDDATALIQEYQKKCGNPALADVPASHLLQVKQTISPPQAVFSPFSLKTFTQLLARILLILLS